MEVYLSLGMMETAVSKAERHRYSFETVMKCEECGSLDTVVVSTPKRWLRWRKCRKKGCEHRQKQVGRLVEPDPAEE